MSSSVGTDAPVALITGGASGIGLATGGLLSRQGFRVYGTSRRTVDDQDGITFLRLDPADPASVAAAVGTVHDRHGRIDVLINNIGGGIAGSVEETSVAEAQAVFDANLWSAVRMTQAVLPGMRARRSGRVIAISSMAGLIGVPFRGVYNASKFALEAAFEALRHEVGSLGIKISIVKATGVATSAAERVPEAERVIEDYRPARGNISERFTDAMRNGLPPEQIAATILRIVSSEHPRFRYPVGMQVRMLAALQRLLPEPVFIAGAGRLFARLGRGQPSGESQVETPVSRRS